MKKKLAMLVAGTLAASMLLSGCSSNDASNDYVTVGGYKGIEVDDVEEPAEVTDDDVKIEPVETHKYLFTTNTCPNCRMAKKMLEGEDLEIIDAEKNPDMARQFGIMQAPTLVITDGEHLKKYVNASNIQKYVDEELD